MLITLEGFAAVAAARSGAANALVRKNGVLRLRFTTLSQPLSGKSSKVAPQAAPALLTRMSSLGSSSARRAARARQPSTVETSCGSDRQGAPSPESAAAAASQAWALREEI